MPNRYAHRFGNSALHQRDARSSLFENYRDDRSRGTNQSPARFGGVSSSGGYGYPGPSTNSSVAMNGGGYNGGFRPATPNKK